MMQLISSAEAVTLAWCMAQATGEERSVASDTNSEGRRPSCVATDGQQRALFRYPRVAMHLVGQAGRGG
jgi:hypothetical protein